MVYNFTYTYGEEPLTEDERLLVGTGNQFGVDIDVEDGFRSLRNRRNRYKIDRLVQKTSTFTGIEGTNTQDRAVQESMGSVVDRTYERLGTTDRAIITARRMLLQAVKQVQAGEDPPGATQDLTRLRAIEQVIAQDESWWEAMRPGLYPEPERLAPLIET
jgi:phthalate 4,5-dioxygenase